MRLRSLHSVFILAASIAFTTAAAAQTDAALSLYGAFTGTTTGNGVQQSPANQAGAILELRHIHNPLIGYEATYSWNRADEVYRPAPGCGAACVTQQPAGLAANAHQISGDWVASVHIANLRPFALAGVGVLFDAPVNSSGTGNTAVKPVFVYGAGADWGLLPHIGLRLQYRGNLYKAPDIANAFSSTGKFTHTAEPMIGVYFRF